MGSLHGLCSLGWLMHPEGLQYCTYGGVGGCPGLLQHLKAPPQDDHSVSMPELIPLQMTDKHDSPGSLKGGWCLALHRSPGLRFWWTVESPPWCAVTIMNPW